MKRLLSIIFFVSVFVGLHAQRVEPFDTVYKFRFYNAYYCEDIQTSTFVVYKVYKPQNKASRKGLDFKSYQGLPHFNYSHTVYDKGHLKPAQDAAGSIEEMKETFWYINAVPQHYKLNRGTWKKIETQIHNLAQSDSLIVVCGGCDYSPQDSIVPQHCFKVVYSLSTLEPIVYYLFSNDSKASYALEPLLLELFPIDYLKTLYSLPADRSHLSSHSR